MQVEQISQLLKQAIDKKHRIKNAAIANMIYSKIRALKPKLGTLSIAQLEELGTIVGAMVAAEQNETSAAVTALRKANPGVDLVTVLRMPVAQQLSMKLNLVEESAARLIKQLRNFGAIVPEYIE